MPDLSEFIGNTIKENPLGKMLPRKLYKTKGPLVGNSVVRRQDDFYEEVDYLGEATLVSSELLASDKYHLPTLDIDMYCALVESSTPGHYHLYIDKVMSWDQYVKLLEVMEEVGILEPGYVAASKDRGATYLRVPGTRKE